PNLSSLPPADQPVIARALAKVPEERHATCRDMVLALREGKAAPTVPGLEINGGEAGALGGADTACDPREAEPPAAVEGRGPVALTRVPSPPVTPHSGGRTSQGPTKWMGTKEPAPTPASRPPSPVADGEGVLFPALVIGVGGAGLAVLRGLRLALHAQAPGPDAFPHVRFLYLDTDADAAR